MVVRNFLFVSAWAAMAFAANVRIVTITASGNDGNLPQNAVDSNISTRWSCSIPPNGECWLQADLGTSQEVSGASLGWYQGSTRTNVFMVHISNDGTTFTTVFAGTSSGMTANMEQYQFPVIRARYVRVSVTDNSLHNGWASITELNVTAPATVKLRISSVTALSNDGNVPQNTIDGSFATRWSCAIPSGNACWLQADLGSTQTLTGANIAWYQGNTRTNTFRLETSQDGAHFTSVRSGTSTGTTNAEEVYSFPATRARYLRISVTDNSLHNGWASITELSVLGYEIGNDAGKRDVFNLTKIYRSTSSGMQWNSLVWHNGHDRDVIDRDPDDSTQVGQRRGDSIVHVNGKGVMTFFGAGELAQPRWYLNQPSTHFFKNTEITVYYERISDVETSYAGLVLGGRSGPDGHSSNGDPCDAHTYYGRFRNDGNKDFVKELKHPESSSKRIANIWGGAPNRLPSFQWIGMKFIIYNTNNNGNVKLELYRDMTEGRNGGTWEKIDELVDTGDWSPPQSSPACSYTRNFIPTVGGGVIILRNTGTREARYKWMSAREIVPPLP